MFLSHNISNDIDLIVLYKYCFQYFVDISNDSLSVNYVKC